MMNRIYEPIEGLTKHWPEQGDDQPEITLLYVFGINTWFVLESAITIRIELDEAELGRH